MQKSASRARAFYIWLMAPLCGAVSILAVFLSLSAPIATAATTSSNLNFQARILGSAGTVVPDGNYNIDFKIYNADSTTGSVGTCSGACLWEETRKNSNSQGVQVINGYFSVNLGSVTSFPAINWDQQLWLTMNIGGTSVGASPTWDGEMQNAGHSIALTALPYSFVAGQLALTSGAHRGTLAFNTVANDPNILLPDASGTVCLQTASACGFEATSGTDFIRNQTSTQTANFNIQSASSGSVAAVIQGAASQSVDLLDLKTSTPSTVLSVGATGSLSVTPANAADTITLGSTSQTGTITLGQSTASNTISIGAAAGASATQAINIGTSSTGSSTTNITVGSTVAGTTTIQSAGGLTINSNTTVSAGKTLTVTSALTSLTGATSGDALNVSNSTSSGNIAIFKDNSTAVFTIADNGLLTISPGAALTGSSTQSHISQTLTNNQTGGTVNGLNQAITISNASGTTTTNGLNITLTDNASALGNTDTGLKISLTGSNTSRQEIGIDSTVSKGIAINATSTGSSSGLSCGGTTGVPVAVCGTASGTSAVGVVGSSSASGSNLNAVISGSGVAGINLTTSPGAGSYVFGTKGLSTPNGSDAAYTSIGVYGSASGSSSATVYGGYFNFANATGTLGSALFASNATRAANIVQFQDNTTDVFTIADGGLITATSNSASGFIIQDSSSSKAVLTVDTSGDAVLLGKAGASGLTGKLTFNNAAGSHTVSILGPSSDPASSFSFTLPSALPGSTQCLQSDNAGALSFSSCVTGSAVTTVGTYSTSNHYSDGASISGSTITLGSADATHPGLIDSSNQTFAGNKTFSGNTVFNGTVLAANTSDSPAAFQIQTSGALDLFNVNTTDGYVIDNGITALGNEVQNPSFESSGSNEGTGWFSPSASQVITNSSANAHSGNYELQVTGNSSTHAVTTKWLAVHPSDTIYTEAWVKNSGGANGDGGIYLEFADKDKGNSTYSNADTGLPGTSYVMKTISTTVPANKFFVRIAASVKATSSTGTFYFDDFYFKKVNESAPLLITNTSSTSFQVQNSSAQTIFGIDSSASKIFSTIPDSGSAVGFTFNTPSYTSAGAKLLSLQNNAAEKFYVDKDGNIVNQGNITASGNISAGSGKQFQINGTQVTSAILSNNSDLAKLSGTGPQVFSGNNEFDGTVLNKVASATAFQVQNASNAVFTVDTSGNKVILGTASNITGKIQFQGSGGAGTLTLAGPTTPDTGNFTLTIPAITGNANVCTDNSICSGYESAAAATASFATKLNKGSVDTSAAAVTAVQGNLYAFTNSSSTIASGVLKLDNGNNTGNALTVTGTNNYGAGNAYIVVNDTNGTPSGYLIDLQANAASEFSVDAAGNVVAAGNISIASGKLYEINGVQITSAALSDGNTLAKLGANQTFSGNNTFSSASNSFTGDGAGLTNLNASNVATGTLSDSRLSSNVALLARSSQTFTGDNSFAPTAPNVGTTIVQTSGTATSGSVLDVQTANGSSHFLQITNAAANEGNVTLQSVGATRDLTLGSASGTLKITNATASIQKASTALSIDLANSSDSLLTITNSGSGIGSLSVEGDIAAGASHVFKVGATSGATTTCSSNTFLQNQVVAGGITTNGNCANAVTTIGSAGGSITNGASITGNSLTLGYADTTNPGLVSNTTQSFNGAKTFTNDLIAKSNSSSAFQVQNTSVRSLFSVDTSGNIVSVGNSTDGSQITLAATGNANGTIRKSMIVTGTVAANDLVEIDTANAGQVQQAAASSTKVFGVATSAVGSGSAQDIVISGIYQLNANASGGTIAVGDTLVSSSTAGQATKAGSTTSAGSVVGLALSTVSGGKVWVYLNLGLGGSDNLQTVYNKSTGGASTTPTIKISSGVGGINIQDADTTISGSLLTVRQTNGSGLGTAILDVQSTGTIATGQTSLTLFNTTATTVNAFQAATTLTIGGTSGTFTVQNANTIIGSAAGSGTLTNNGATLNATLALGNLAAGSIGSAASTVDIYTSFSIAPAASGRAYTLPTPTASTSYGRVIHIGNIAAAGNFFTISGIRIPPGSTGTLIWSNSNGGASWQFAGAGGASIENQNSSDQVADFRISGTGQAATSFVAPLFDTATGVTLAIGTNTATAIHLDQDTTVKAGKEIIVGTNATDLTCTNGAIYYNTGTNRFKGCENGAWITIDSFVDVKNYTSGDTSWSLPQNASVVQVILIGGGGGGGGGGAKTGGAEKQAGGGGGGGAYASQIFSAADISAISSTAHASVGSAGSSGAGAPSSNNNGSNGGAGGNSCFSQSASCTGTIYVEAYGGGAGAGGGGTAPGLGGGGGGGGTAAAGTTATTATGGAGGLPGAAGANTNATGGNGGGGGSAGATGSATSGNPGGAAEYGGGGGGGSPGGAGTGGAGGSSLHGAGGGGAGASLNSGNSNGLAGAGGVSQSNASGGGGTAGTNSACNAGGTGGNGSASTTTIKAGAGGGGGNALGGGGNNVSCNGGNGGAAGGGGGGGGASSGTGGNGGTGAAGEIWVISW